MGMNCDERKNVSCLPKKKKNHHAVTGDNPVYNQRQNPDMFKEKIIVTAVTLMMRRGFLVETMAIKIFAVAASA